MLNSAMDPDSSPTNNQAMTFFWTCSNLKHHWGWLAAGRFDNGFQDFMNNTCDLETGNLKNTSSFWDDDPTSSRKIRSFPLHQRQNPTEAHLFPFFHPFQLCLEIGTQNGGTNREAIVTSHGILGNTIFNWNISMVEFLIATNQDFQWHFNWIIECKIENRPRRWADEDCGGDSSTPGCAPASKGLVVGRLLPSRLHFCPTNIS